jgi:phosphoglycerate dehydrogenase-like enzyme
MRIKKASPGLDQRNRLGSILGPGYVVENYDEGKSLSEQVGDAEVILVRDIPITARVIAAAPNLRLIQRPGDHLPVIDFEAAKGRGILVSRFPSRIQGTSARDVAEHALFLMLCLAKRYPESSESVRNRTVGLPKTMRIAGKTLGLVGLGNTGSELGRIATAVGMRVIAVRRSQEPGLRKKLDLDWLGAFEQLPNLLAQSHFVSLHLPMTPDTVDFIGAGELASMREGAFLINISRGPLVNRAALYDALTSGRLGGAGLDVFWEEPPEPNDPLLRLEQVVFTPHIAGDTEEVEICLAELTAENVRRLARGETPRYVVGIDVGPEGEPFASPDAEEIRS